MVSVAYYHNGSNTYNDNCKVFLHNSYMLKLHEKIRTARKHAGFTQQQLAELCGTKREAVTQWEAKNEDKRTKPSLESLISTSKHTRAPLEWLVFDDINIDHDKNLPWQSYLNHQQEKLHPVLQDIINLLIDKPDEELQSMRVIISSVQDMEMIHRLRQESPKTRKIKSHS